MPDNGSTNVDHVPKVPYLVFNIVNNQNYMFLKLFTEYTKDVSWVTDH